MKVLSLNAGSNSLKFEVVEVEVGKPFGETITKGSYDNIGKNAGSFSLFEGKRAVQSGDAAVPTYGRAAELLLERLDGQLREMERIGHRVVHGGDLFEAPARIDEEAIRKIEALEDLAPLHNASALEVIRTFAERVDSDVPMVAVFDTLFHQTIPETAALYALPLDLARRYKIRRYGFHGISHRYMLLRYGQITGRPEEECNLITLHLEGGSSAAAIRQGQSVDTSMGFTPLEGLMMGTRCGDMDPAIVPYLMRKENLDAEAVDQFLNRKCGLLGVSGANADTRELRKQMDRPDVRLALEMFSYRARKYVGAYLAALGGAEAVIFGGGIGENTASVREEICSGLECLGIRLDRQRNEKTIDCEGMISPADSPVKVWVIPTQEAKMVAYETAVWQ